MNRKRLESFIKKYHLGGTCEKSVWTVDNQKHRISTAIKSEDKSLLIFNSIKYDGELEDSKLGIGDTGRLLKLLNVLDDEVEFKFNRQGTTDNVVSMILSSKNSEITYVTSLTKAIEVPVLLKLPEFHFSIKITKEFARRFIKAQGSMGNTNRMTLLELSGDLKLVLGYSRLNSDRIVLDLDIEEKTMSLHDILNFDASHFKEILNINSISDDDPVTLRVSNHGLMMIEFLDDEFTNTYYLAKI